jgi:hypothetical protein
MGRGRDLPSICLEDDRATGRHRVCKLEQPWLRQMSWWKINFMREVCDDVSDELIGDFASKWGPA